MMEELTAYDEAILEGELRTSRRTLLLMARKLFGRADTAEAEVTNISDLDRLDRMHEAILTAKSWEELLATQ